LYFGDEVEGQIDHFQVGQFLQVLNGPDLIAHKHDGSKLREVLDILDGPDSIFAQIDGFQLGEVGDALYIRDAVVVYLNEGVLRLSSYSLV